MGVLQTMPISFGTFHRKIHPLSRLLSRRKIPKLGGFCENSTYNAVENTCHIFRRIWWFDRGADPQYRSEASSVWICGKASPVLLPDWRWWTGWADFWNWERPIPLPPDRTVQRRSQNSSQWACQEKCTNNPASNGYCRIWSESAVPGTIEWE